MYSYFFSSAGSFSYTSPSLAAAVNPFYSSAGPYSNTSPSVAVAVNWEDIKMLVGMGFSELDASKALAQHDDMQQAVDFLLAR